MADLNLKIPAVDKLLEFVASGIGAVGGPLLARWKASRGADAARIEAQGQADVMRIQAQGQADSMSLIASAQADARNHLATGEQLIQGEIILRKEIESRLTFQEQKRQNNIGAVVGLAASELDDKEVQNHEVDHDWVARFFSDVQDVTSEHMQRIWAKILSGEVETPGRTSLHTLSILKNMTQRDAKLFEDVSRFVFNDFILNEKLHTIRIPGFPDYSKFLILESYGLLHAAGNLNKNIDVKSEEYVFFTKNMAYQIFKEDNTSSELVIPAFPLSHQGRELYSIVGSIIDDNYLSEIACFLRDDNFILKCAEIQQHFGSHVIVGPWVSVEPLPNHS